MIFELIIDPKANSAIDPKPKNLAAMKGLSSFPPYLADMKGLSSFPPYLADMKGLRAPSLPTWLT